MKPTENVRSFVDTMHKEGSAAAEPSVSVRFIFCANH